MKFIYIIFTLASILLFTVLTCEIDHGIAPLPGKVAATIYFHGTPPSNTQGIYLTVAPQFPPHAINELYQSPNSLPVDQDSVYFELELPYGHYEAISLWWYNKETKSNLADILALPLDPQNQLLPLDFNITPENPVFNIFLSANWNRVNRDASIEGTIVFNGPFPNNTLATAVAAFQYFPEKNIHYLLYLKSMDFSIDKNPYHYKLPVRHGDIDYIAVFWLPERANLTDFRTLGFYQDPALNGEPGKLSLTDGEIVRGIDIYADWSVIKN